MIKQALDAMDKATPWPWWGDDEAPDFIWAKRDGETFHVVDARGCDELSANCHIIAAAPDMAAWIKEALPILQAFDNIESKYSGYAESELQNRVQKLIKKAQE